jgi:hypothetical protein
MANKGMVIPPQLMGWWDCITQLMEDSEVMVIPPVILHFIRIFHYKSTILLWTVTFKDDSGWLVSAEGDTKQPPGYRSGRNSSRGCRLRDWLNEPCVGDEPSFMSCTKGTAFRHQLLSFRFWRRSLELIGRFCLNHGKIPGLLPPQTTSVHSEAYLRPAATAACIPRVPWKWIHSLLGCWTWFIENDLK